MDLSLNLKQKTTTYNYMLHGPQHIIICYVAGISKSIQRKLQQQMGRSISQSSIVYVLPQLLKLHLPLCMSTPIPEITSPILPFSDAASIATCSVNTHGDGFLQTGHGAEIPEWQLFRPLPLRLLLVLVRARVLSCWFSPVTVVASGTTKHFKYGS